MKPTRKHAKAFLKLLDKYGLIKGLGQPEPGRMCVEAAWCYVLGLPHGDDPGCVGTEVRQLKIGLNDKTWSTPAARAAGLARLGLAQIGSDQLDQKEFQALFWFRCGTELQPAIWRWLATKKDKDCRLAFATRMEGSKSLEECKAHAYAHAHAHAYAYDYDYGYDYGYNYAHAHAYDYAYAHAHAYAYELDCWLTKVAELAVQVLIEMKSPGTKWLNLRPAKLSAPI